MSPTLKTSSKYPSLHKHVAKQLAVDNLNFGFHAKGTSRDAEQEYDTLIKGVFVCDNAECGNEKWTSKSVAITIRMFAGRRYNATVYHQRCMKCDSLSRPWLDSSYTDRVTYRLKKWCGVQMVTTQYSGESNGPHQKELCEGCKAGHCSKLLRV